MLIFCNNRAGENRNPLVDGEICALRRESRVRRRHVGAGAGVGARRRRRGGGADAARGARGGRGARGAGRTRCTGRRRQKRAALSPGGAQKQECHLPQQASGITKKEDEALATSRSSTRVSHG